MERGGCFPGSIGVGVFEGGIIPNILPGGRGGGGFLGQLFFEDIQ